VEIIFDTGKASTCHTKKRKTRIKKREVASVTVSADMVAEKT
jgi:hypothetical protein